MNDSEDSGNLQSVLPLVAGLCGKARIPNPVTVVAMEEARHMMAERQGRFLNANALFSALDANLAESSLAGK